MSLKEFWDSQADAWKRFVRTPGHDAYHEGFNFPAFLEFLPPPGRRTLDLGCGEGRVGLALTRLGHRVVGVDSSPAMLEVARAAATEAGVSERIDLRLGDLRDPPVPERVPLVVCPFRSLLHMETEADKLRALRAARGLLEPGGTFVFDVFSPSREDIEETDGRWLEREPGIFERADWDEDARTLSLSVRSDDGSATTFGLHWLSAPEWLRLLDEAELDVEALYGWFDGRPHDGDEDMVFVTRRR